MALNRLTGINIALMTNSSKNEKTLESLLNDLEQLVETMEKGEIGLEDLITHYEKGSELLKKCQEKVKLAELRIFKLKEGTENTLDPFELKD